MIVLLFFSFIALLLTSLEQKGSVKNGFGWGMVLVTLIAAIHYNFGSDYWEYFYSYQDVIRYHYSLRDVLFGELSNKGENGWYLLMFILKPLGVSGFFVLVALVAIFQGVVVYKLIKKYVPKQWMVFALYVYLFCISLYVGSMSGIRQHLAMTIVGCAAPFIVKKKIIPSIIIILVASTIHTSSLIFLPFVLWGYVPLYKTRYLSIIFIILYIVFLISASLTEALIGNFIVMDEFEQYETYTGVENKFTYSFGYVFSMLFPYIITIVYLYNNNSDETKNRLVSLVAAGMTLLPVMASVHLGIRLLYYFDFIAIVTFPIVFGSIKNKTLRTSLISVYSLYIFYVYYAFFHSEQRYATTYYYHSLFDLI